MFTVVKDRIDRTPAWTITIDGVTKVRIGAAALHTPHVTIHRRFLRLAVSHLTIDKLDAAIVFFLFLVRQAIKIGIESENRRFSLLSIVSEMHPTAIQAGYITHHRLPRCPKAPS